MFQNGKTPTLVNCVAHQQLDVDVCHIWRMLVRRQYRHHYRFLATYASLVIRQFCSIVSSLVLLVKQDSCATIDVKVGSVARATLQPLATFRVVGTCHWPAFGRHSHNKLTTSHRFASAPTLEIRAAVRLELAH